MSALARGVRLASAADPSPPPPPVHVVAYAFVGVIAVVVIIPCILLSALGVYAYYRSWNNAQVVFGDAAYRRANEIAVEVASVQSLKLTPTERSRLQAAIVQAYGMGHPDGAWYATEDELRYNGVLPAWALKSLQTKGYAIGTQAGPSADMATGRQARRGQVACPFADIVAWRLSPRRCATTRATYRTRRTSR